MSSVPPLSKAALRQQAKQIRASLPMAGLSREICRHLEALPVWQAASVILAYAPLLGEVDCWPLLQALEKPCYLPRTLWEPAALRFHHYTPGDPLTPNGYGVREPLASAPVWDPQATSTPVLILVPGLMFDGQGHRLGFGKGYYDGFLSSLPPDLPKTLLGVTPGALRHPGLPHDPWDVPVDGVVTEAGAIFSPSP